VVVVVVVVVVAATPNYLRQASQNLGKYSYTLPTCYPGRAFDTIRPGGPRRTSADVSVPRLAGFSLITFTFFFDHEE
jgi:hypothetical protein